jgi:hypothetical protein
MAVDPPNKVYPPYSSISSPRIPLRRTRPWFCYLFARETINYRFLKLLVALARGVAGKSGVEMTILAGEPKHPLGATPISLFNRHIFVMTINFKWPIGHFANPDRPLYFYD